MAIRFLAGQPVPYSVTVQYRGCSVSNAKRYLDQFRAYMRQSTRREVVVRNIDGAYIQYDLMPEGFERPRFSVASIDVGFDVRTHDMPVAYPHEGPVILEYSTNARGDKPSTKVTRLCDTTDEAVRVLRRHGYRVVWGS